MSSSESLDQRKRRAVQQTTGINKLPWRIAALCCTFLDSKSLSRVQSANRNLRSLPLDALWRARYLLEFEEQSIDDACIATEGVQTSWKKRWMNRARVESNRRELRFSTTDVRLQPSDQPGTRRLLGATTSLAVGRLRNPVDRELVGVFSLSDGKEQWRVEACQSWMPAVLLDGCLPTVLVARSNHLLVQLDLRSGVELKRWNIHAAAEVTLFAGKRLLAVCGCPSYNCLQLVDVQSDSPLPPAISFVGNGGGFGMCRIDKTDSRLLVTGATSIECWDVHDIAAPVRLWRLGDSNRSSLACLNATPGDGLPYRDDRHCLEFVRSDGSIRSAIVDAPVPLSKAGNDYYGALYRDVFVFNRTPMAVDGLFAFSLDTGRTVERSDLLLPGHSHVMAAPWRTCVLMCCSGPCDRLTICDFAVDA